VRNHYEPWTGVRNLVAHRELGSQVNKLRKSYCGGALPGTRTVFWHLPEIAGTHTLSSFLLNVSLDSAFPSLPTSLLAYLYLFHITPESSFLEYATE
jgi:hypothetical protein